ncbi:cytochrome P450 [Panaeolus papilionaceus]|nr:cytochrome P450 [Panaeolus papilionaceus]
MEILNRATTSSPVAGGGLALIVSFLVWKLYGKLFSRQSILHLLPGPKPDSWIAGSLPKLFAPEGWEYNIQLGREYGRVMSLQALFGSRILYTSDPLAMHYIFVKEQDNYEETEHLISISQMMFGPGILSTVGEQHRKQRKLLNPVFSIKHLRTLTPAIYSVAQRLEKLFLEKTASGPQEIDILTWMTRTSLEVIGQSGFGYSFEPLTEGGKSHPYSTCVKEIIPMTMRPGVLLARLVCLPTIIKLGLPRFWEMLISLVPWKSLQEIRDTCNLMHRTASEIYEWKKETLHVDDTEGGNDVLSILMRENMKEKAEDAMSEKEVLAQISSIAFAATETTSGTLSRILHLLTLNPNVQETLRNEIIAANEGNDGPLDYDTLSALPYLDAVCRETLRMYPPLIATMRQFDTVLPLSQPIKTKDGKLISEIPLSKGNDVLVLLINCNCDRTLWGPDAEEWKPERWLSPLPAELIEAKIPGIYSHLMSFLGGARSCIGVKFAQIEIKVILAILLQKFKFSLSDKEIKWQVTAMASPVVVGDESHPRLPLMVARIST